MGSLLLIGGQARLAATFLRVRGERSFHLHSVCLGLACDMIGWGGAGARGPRLRWSSHAA